MTHNDNCTVCIDWGNGHDRTIITLLKRAGRLRRLMRRIGLDRSNWKYKVVGQREL